MAIVADSVDVTIDSLNAAGDGVATSGGFRLRVPFNIRAAHVEAVVILTR